MTLAPLYTNLSPEDRALFAEIAEYAMQLGYKPKKSKTAAINYVFTSSRIRKHLLKFSIEQGEPVLKMKFYASKNYSPLFQEGIRAVIEEYDYKYTGCYGCGKCPGELEGYTYVYPDGRSYFRCGGELISVPGITRDELPEIKELLERQHTFYAERK